MEFIMCNINLRKLVVFGFAAANFLVGAAGAQTISQIAQMQRERVNEEIRAATTPPPAVAMTPSPAPVVMPKQPVAKTTPTITVHAIYSRSGAFIAELTDGQTLSVAVPGMRYGRTQIGHVDTAGVHLIALPGCKRKCPPERVVPVGGRL